MKTTDKIPVNTADWDGSYVGDSRSAFKVGDRGFLVRILFPEGKPRLELRTHPASTPQPHFDPYLYGEVDSRSTRVIALGCAVIEEVAPSGRGKIRTLHGQELLDALEYLGYPELADEA